MISLAYSPDTDDAFMVYALKEKKIDWQGLDFEFISADIQKLNQATLAGKYDVSAISIALFPAIKDDYELLPIGASVGDKFGPVVVCAGERSDLVKLSDLEARRVAMPGVNTSAFFAASELLPNCQWVEMPFDEIEPAIKTGAVDAGILIHELQINYENFGLRKLVDLGQLWDDKFSLPLPLGGIVIRKSLAAELKSTLLDLYRSSIKYAFAHQELVLAQASEWAKEGLDASLSEKYISMYVNHDSLDLSPAVQQGIRELFRCGYKNGLCPSVDFLGTMISR